MYTDADYRSQVLADYHAKKLAGELTPALIELTTAGLRDECLIVFESRYETRDEKFLQAFFNPERKNVDLHQAIFQYPVDRFRSLSYLLRGRTSDTHPRNIELLAWLINFEPRPRPVRRIDPYEVSGTMPTVSVIPEIPNDSLVQPTLGVLESSERATASKTNEAASSHTPQFIGDLTVSGQARSQTGYQAFSHFLRHYRWVLITATIVLGCGTGYLFWQNRSPNVLQAPQQALVSPNECMYWAGEHFRSIGCKVVVKDVSVVALDQEQLQHLHKITRLDTITRAALGHVWYCKAEGLEFFTDSGFHPRHPERRLLPLTLYMYYKYLYPRKLSSQPTSM